VDSHYAFVPLTAVGGDTGYSITATFGLSIDSALGAITDPFEYVYLTNRTLPQFLASEQILQVSGTTNSKKNFTNGMYWMGAKADCGTGTVQTCKDNVEAEISFWTFLNNASTTHWPPYTLYDQRRTAKFSLAYQKWLYFWLTVTNNNLDSNGVFNLYLGVQFFSDGSDSAVQMSLWKPTDPWPTATVNGTAGAEEFYPLSPSQKNNWILEAPWPIPVGMWKIAAQTTVNNQAQFTVKAGFNKAPTQAANLNASFNRVGFLTLVTLCIMKHLFF